MTSGVHIGIRKEIKQGISMNMEVSWSGGTPKSSIYRWIFHCIPSIWGYPHLWKASNNQVPDFPPFLGPLKALRKLKIRSHVPWRLCRALTGGVAISAGEDRGTAHSGLAGCGVTVKHGSFGRWSPRIARWDTPSYVCWFIGLSSTSSPGNST